MPLTTTVFATTQVVGFHHWPEAPDTVRYLRDLHRHLFGITVQLTVDGPDREVEFHILKRQLDSWLSMMQGPTGGKFTDGTFEIIFGRMSCEAIASALMAALRTEYPGRAFYSVMVDEDDENGAIVTYEPD